MMDTQTHPDGGSRAEGPLTEGQHTPGPWEVTAKKLQVQFRGRPDGWFSFISVERPGFHAGGGIALVHVKGHADSDANARLIAQAPDLLAERDHLRQHNAELGEVLMRLIRLIDRSSLASETEAICSNCERPYRTEHTGDTGECCICITRKAWAEARAVLARSQP